ncbi:hypothetical protein GCM10023219_28970 [Stakelama sediminis]
MIVIKILGEYQFGRYALILSAATIFAQIVDFGQSRYLFKQAHKGMGVGRLAFWSILSRLLSLAVLILPASIYAYAAGISVLAFIAGALSIIISQLITINRYKLIMDGKILVSIFLDSLQGIIFFLLILSTYESNFAVSVGAVFLMMLISFLVSFLASVIISSSGPAWIKALKAVARTSIRRSKKGVAFIALNSIYVGIEMFLTVSRFSLPVILAEFLGFKAEVAAVGLFQRIIGLEISLISVTVTAKIKDYYRDGVQGIINLAPAAISALVTGAGAYLGLVLFGPVTSWLGLNSASTLLSLLDSLAGLPCRIAVATAAVAFYIHLSMAVLGADKRKVRCISAGVGVALMVVLASTLPSDPYDRLSIIIDAFAIGQFASIACLMWLAVRCGIRFTRKSTQQDMPVP